MTAPAEDPRGGEACVCGHGWDVHEQESLMGGSCYPTDSNNCPCFSFRPAASRGDTDSGGETVTLNGHEVTVVVEPELEWRGTTTWTPDFNGRARPPVRIRLRNGVGDLDGRVLLHEVLHALIGTDPQAVLPPDDPRHEDFVRMLTAGLHDAMGYRRPAGDRAQPTQELREAIKDTLFLYGIRGEQLGSLRPGSVADALLAGPLAALLDAPAAVNRVEAVMAAWDRGQPVGGYLPREIRRALGGTT